MHHYEMRALDPRYVDRGLWVFYIMSGFSLEYGYYRYEYYLSLN